ncbi:hypothetical protein [Amycolatopsis sp. NBC_01480]|uniref:hypothetical protein n=1 Tax=Amycolatopsis sp. NBC_01480 TaxID=2903562 RepID=UPI002E27DED7|nr:hypothetical protein [Amycolatopsis sp. NBC_01480]
MRRRGLSPEQVDEAIHLHKLGWSLARVGDHVGVNHATVLNKLRERGIPTRDTPTGDPAPKQVELDDPACGYVHSVSLDAASVVHVVTVAIGVVVGLTLCSASATSLTSHSTRSASSGRASRRTCGRRTIARLRRELFGVPGRVTHHARNIELRLPPGPQLLTAVLTRIQALPRPD